MNSFRLFIILFLFVGRRPSPPIRPSARRRWPVSCLGFARPWTTHLFSTWNPSRREYLFSRKIQYEINRIYARPWGSVPFEPTSGRRRRQPPDIRYGPPRRVGESRRVISTANNHTLAVVINRALFPFGIPLSSARSTRRVLFDGACDAEDTRVAWALE